MSFKYDSELIAEQFKMLDAIKFAKPGEEFTLKSGRKSRFYLDCRLVTLNGIGNYYIGYSLFGSINDQLDDVDPDATRIYIGAVGVGGAPIVGSILNVAGNVMLPWQGFIVRDAEKDHGLKRKIEGHIGTDGPIVLVEDVITTGSSILEAAEAVRALGFKPIGVHCVVDRSEGGREALAIAGLPLFSLLGLKDLLAMESSNDQVCEGRCN